MRPPVERLVRPRRRNLSSREVDEGPGMRWTVMADPAGNEFCVAQK